MYVKVTVLVKIDDDFHPDAAAQMIDRGLQHLDDPALHNWQMLEIAPAE